MYKYMIVDDEMIIRKGLIVRIEDLKLDIELVGEGENGAEGIDILKAANPDIIFTDMRMPLMDGRDFLEYIHENFPDKKVIVISGYSDYEYMHAAINSSVVDYILKPFDSNDIKKSIMKAISMINKEKTANSKIDLLEKEINQIQYQQDLQGLLNAIVNPATDLRSLRLNYIRINNEENSDNMVLVNVFISPQNFRNDLKEIWNSSKEANDSIFISNTLNEGEYSILLCFKNDDEEKRIQGVYDFFHELMNIEDGMCNIYVCISKAVKSIADLNKAYLQNIDLLQYRELGDRRGIYKYEDICKQSQNENIEKWDKYKEIISAVKGHDVCKIRELINSFFTFIENREGLTFKSLKDSCINLYKAVEDYFKLKGISMKGGFVEGFMQNYIYINDTSKLRNDLINIFINLANEIQGDGHNTHSLAEEIKKYIEKNYNFKITLEAISEKFFINSSYCSYIFKEKIGENLNEYLTKIRIEKSKSLLKNTKLSIEVVSKEIGYSNPKYFFKIFKKYVGTTPLEFRNSI